MAITTKTVTGKIVIPGTTIGIRANVSATPMTTANALTFPADDTISWGPVSTTTNAAGTLTPALAIPTSQAETAVMWKVVAEPIDKHPGLPKSWTLGYYQITGTGTVDLADLVEIDVTVIDPGTIVSVQALVTDAETARDAAQAAQAAAEAVGSTNDTIIAGRVNDPASATRTALSATIASANSGGALAVAVDPVVLSATTYPIGVVGDVVYGTDGTNLRRSTDAGDTWTTIVNTLTGHSIARLGNGEMIVISESNVRVSSGWTDANPAAATWAVTATPTTNGGTNPGAAFIKSDWDVWDNYVLLGEYVTPDRTNSRKLRLSTDYGQTFTEIFDLNTYYAGVWLPADIHYHAVCIDPFATSLTNPRLWFTHGDFGRGMYYSDNLGATWTAFHGAAGSDWDTFTTNPMTVTATKRGLVIGTDANVPDGIYIAKRTADDNPANWVIKRGATIPFDYVAGSLLGFTERSWRDDRTGLVWIVMRANHPGTVTTPLPARVFVSDGERAAIAYETPEARTSTAGGAITVQGAWVAGGKLLFSYSNAGAGFPDRVVRLTPGGRGGRSYQDMNRGNALLGYSASRVGVAIGYNAYVSGQSVAVGSGAADTGDYNSTIGYGAITKGNGVANGFQAVAESHSVAIGYLAATMSTEALASGSQAIAWQNSVAIGRNAAAGASGKNNCVAIGRNAAASTNSSATAIGNASTASGVNSTATGSNALASGSSGTATGSGAQATGSNSLALGQGATATNSNTTAIGVGASASGNGSVAIGRDSAGVAATTSTINEFVLGTASHQVKVPGRLNTAASTTAQAGLVVAHGVAPTTPTNGAIWTDTTGMYVRINGVTKTVTLT